MDLFPRREWTLGATPGSKKPELESGAAQVNKCPSQLCPNLWVPEWLCPDPEGVEKGHQRSSSGEALHDDHPQASTAGILAGNCCVLGQQATLACSGE